MLAHGDYKNAFSIYDQNKDCKSFVVYGANSIGGRPQNLAVGYFDGDKYFFVNEYFKGNTIYAQNPSINLRNIVICKSISKSNTDDVEKIVFNSTLPELEAKLTSDEQKAFQELVSKINFMQQGFTETDLRSRRIPGNGKHGVR